MKKLLVVCLLCISCAMFTGCDSKRLSEDSDDISTWIIPDNARFVPVNIYSISNGTVSEIDITTYVDLENGTMWLHTSSYRAGYGTTFVKLTDENNNACIYEDLDELKDKYNYKEG